MKKILFLSIFTIIINHLIAQDKPITWIGINTSAFSGISLSEFDTKEKMSYLVGLGFERKLNNHLHFETGIDFSRINLIYTDYYIGGSSSEIKREAHFYLLSIPFNLKVKLKNDFFVTGGIQYNRQLKEKVEIEKAGLGLNFKIGKDFKFGKDILSVSPEIKLYNFTSFPYLEYYGYSNNLAEFGIRVSYKFGL